ncbi:MAG: ribosome silencing factor [Bacillaceae bacterium]|nr:ribosome silencing factor [Bacillaceae bacterium]
MNETNILKLAVKAADDKKADNIVILDMKGISLISDYFVICQGGSEKQVAAIATEIKKTAQANDIVLKRLEGIDQSRWVLIDLDNVVVHIFHKDERLYYNLEKLWGDAPIVDIDEVLGS